MKKFFIIATNQKLESQFHSSAAKTLIGTFKELLSYFPCVLAFEFKIKGTIRNFNAFLMFVPFFILKFYMYCENSGTIKELVEQHFNH